MRYSGGLPLLVLSALEHPGREARERCRQLLKRWLEDSEPSLTVPEVEARLDQEAGTPLEPFTIEGEDRGIAVIMARAALSSHAHTSRFRVVSGETIGNRGGAVLLKSGKQFYAERFALGSNRLRRTRAPFYAPSMRPRTFSSCTWTGQPPVRMHTDTHGMRITVGVPADYLTGWPRRPGRLIPDGASNILKHSTIGPQQLSLEEAGIGLTADSNEIVMSCSGAENLIRFNALAIDGVAVRLAAGPEFVHRYSIEIHIPPLEMAEQPWVRLVAEKDFAKEWMRADSFPPPSLASEDIEVITQPGIWHRDWLVDEEQTL